jgi:nitroreductase
MFFQRLKFFSLIGYLKSYGRLITGAYGFFYDYLRLAKFSAWNADMADPEIRGYHAVKIYHALEKSMSYKSRNPKYGWSSSFLLLDVLRKAEVAGNVGFHDLAACNVLRKFISLPENKYSDNARIISNELEQLALGKMIDGENGVKEFSLRQFHQGLLEKPEDFFFSRYSLREFKQESVAESVVQHAIQLATKTPSVCNRQPWHVYHTSEKVVIEKSLSLQSGNRGFGHVVPNLMLVTVDLKAFMSGSEHYQHWIDGGMFSMSLVYALHSLGVASCCLNWSQSPSIDRALRKRLNIDPSHTVIMMLAFGWPDSDNKVCVSARRPIENFNSKLTLR